MDTLPVPPHRVRRRARGVDVVAVVGDSPTVGRFWTTPLALLFIDGGHGTIPPTATTSCGRRTSRPGGTLCIHDVFPDPADGGRPPYEIYLPGPRRRLRRAPGRGLAAGAHPHPLSPNA
jgi:hypothetical protein